MNLQAKHFIAEPVFIDFVHFKAECPMHKSQTALKPVHNIKCKIGTPISYLCFIYQIGCVETHLYYTYYTICNYDMYIYMSLSLIYIYIYLHISLSFIYVLISVCIKDIQGLVVGLPLLSRHVAIAMRCQALARCLEPKSPWTAAVRDASNRQKNWIIVGNRMIYIYIQIDRKTKTCYIYIYRAEAGGSPDFN